MSNNRGLKSSAMKTPMRDRLAGFVWTGYEDKRHRRAFIVAYDDWSEIEQRAYEVGRAYATLAGAQNAPKWHRGRLLRLPDNARDAARAEHSHHRTGTRPHA